MPLLLSVRTFNRTNSAVQCVTGHAAAWYAAKGYAAIWQAAIWYAATWYAATRDAEEPLVIGLAPGATCAGMGAEAGTLERHAA